MHAPCPSKPHFLLVFQKSGFDEPEIMVVEQIVGAFHLDCKANFITVESLTPIHWPIAVRGSNSVKSELYIQYSDYYLLSYYFGIASLG